jgi:DegV family protein with EDD domain
MTVRIVTDSTSDIPAQMADDLGISVVPLYARFGDKVYRDRVDISETEFYDKLLHNPTHPKTSQPSLQDFLSVYERLANETDGIISIHISSKFSGTCDSALQAKKQMAGNCPIEVVDSQSVSMGLGILALIASRLAASGKNLSQITEEVRNEISNIHMLGFFDTLKYLALGGRLGKAKALLGSILNVKPVLAIKDGEFVPAGNVRSRAKGIERVLDFVGKFSAIKDLAIVHSTTPDEAQELAKRISSKLHKANVVVSRLGAALGVHGGPGTLFVALRGNQTT